MNSEKIYEPCRCITYFGQRGVGTSTLTKELAIAFSKDVSVCLVDMAPLLPCPGNTFPHTSNTYNGISV